MSRTPDDFVVLAGSASSLFAALAVGSDGAILAAFIRDSDEVNYWDVRRARRRAAYLTN